MKKNKKLINSILISTSLMSANFVLLTSCNRPTPPPEENIHIDAPTSREKTIVLNDSKITEIIFYGFQYKNIDDITTIHVSDTFVFPEGIIPDPQNPTCIFSCDPSHKTFAVKITILGDAKGTTITGKILFESTDGKTIEYDQDAEYSITLLQYDLITFPKETSAETDLKADGSAEVVFHDFKFHGESDPTKFEVTNTFSQRGAIFTSTIENWRESDNLFDVKVTITNNPIPSRKISGYLSFWHQGVKIPVEFDDLMNIVINISKSITISSEIDRFYSTTIDESSKTASFTIKNIQFTGLEDKNKLQVFNESFDSIAEPFCDEITYEITDWNLESKSFSLTITFMNCHISDPELSVIGGEGFFKTIDSDLPLSFSFKYDGKDIDVDFSGKSRFDFAVNCPIPYDDLKIENGVLKAWNQEELQKRLFAYDTLLIPSNVVEIEENAFKDVFNDSQSAYRGHIQYLDFSRAYNLKKIGANAFSGCINLFNTFQNNEHNIYVKNGLVLPDSLISIGDYAFKNCVEIKGPLVLPKNYVNGTTIGKAPFRNVPLDEIFIPTTISVAYTKRTEEEQEDPVLEGEASFCDLKDAKIVHFEDYERSVPTWMEEADLDGFIFGNLGLNVIDPDDPDTKVQIIIRETQQIKEQDWQEWLTQKASISLDNITFKKIF